MSDCFIGEIRMFGGNYAPLGWAQCDGQTLSISQNEALYSLIGTTYGGDGSTNFKLPEMRGRIPIHRGTGTGLTPRTIAQSFGSETATVDTGQLPQHTHALYASTSNGTSNSPAGNVLAGNASTFQIYTATATAPVAMNPSALGMAGGNSTHQNMMPTQCVNFIIALEGIFPTQN